MTYSKTTWTNGVTPINETNLNKIEDELQTLEQDNVIVSSTEPVSDRRKVWIQKGKNLIKEFINGLELYSATGNTGVNADWCITDYIKIVPGQNYVASGLSSYNKWFYDENYSFISKIGDNPATAPANARYLRLNSTIAGLNNPILVQGTSTGTYEAYVNKKVCIKNDNDVYEDFYDENNIPENVTIITDDVNLNGVKKTGLYYFGVGHTYTNIPAGVNGWLRVMGGSSVAGAVKQIWYRHGTADTNDYETYVRTCADGTNWSNWTLFFTNKNTSGTPTYNTTYLNNVKRNAYVKNGNVVQLTFIGYISQAIPNGTTILSNIPSSAINGLRLITYTGSGEYSKTAIGGNAYFGENTTYIKSFGEVASKWLHIDLTYITSS